MRELPLELEHFCQCLFRDLPKYHEPIEWGHMGFLGSGKYRRRSHPRRELKSAFCEGTHRTAPLE